MIAFSPWMLHLKYFLPIRQRTELYRNHYSKNAKSSHTASLSSDFQVTLWCIYVETITLFTWKTSYPLTHCLASLQRMSYFIPPTKTWVDRIFSKTCSPVSFFLNTIFFLYNLVSVANCYTNYLRFQISWLALCSVQFRQTDQVQAYQNHLCYCSFMLRSPWKITHLGSLPG